AYTCFSLHISRPSTAETSTLSLHDALPIYVHVTGIDFSPKMLAKAEEKIERVKAKVILREMDAEKMDFPDNTFDNVVSTCVFCSVPDPVKGLKEIRRVVKPEGKIVMLE